MAAPQTSVEANIENKTQVSDILELNQLVGETKSLQSFLLNYTQQHGEKVTQQLVNAVYPKDILQLTALMSAALIGHTSSIDILIHHGASLNTKSYIGNTALIYAVMECHESCVDLLLLNGANVDIKNIFGMSSLSCAAKNGHVSCMDILIRHGADVDDRSANGSTALMFAVLYDRSSCVDILLRHDADIHLKDNDGYSALECAVQRRSTTSIKVLLTSAINRLNWELLTKMAKNDDLKELDASCGTCFSSDIRSEIARRQMCVLFPSVDHSLWPSPANTTEKCGLIDSFFKSQLLDVNVLRIIERHLTEK
jgi:ankyrin repeat protein